MDIKATPYSNLKVFAHMDKLLAAHAGDRTAPVYVRIKPTNRCNHRCYYCSYADSNLALRDSVNEGDQIPRDKMLEIIKDLGNMGVKAVTFSGGGEPLVYPHINEAMSMILDEGIDLSIITNGQLLEGDSARILQNARWVRISFDSANEETYAKQRGLPREAFKKVCKNIEAFAKAKPSGCELGINFVVNHENAHEAFVAAKLVKDLGANHIKYTARITKDLDNYHSPFKNDVIKKIHMASELSGNGFSVINKYEDDFLYSTVFSRVYKKCFIKELFTVIAADSKVYFCHDKAYVKEGVVADLRDVSFMEAWYSQEVQERYKEFDAMKECKHHCVYDDRNMLLNSFFSLKKEHINFI